VHGVTTERRRPVDDAGAGPDFRARLLDAMAACIELHGYRATTVADVVRRARTSRRTFYEHFPDKEACFVALITDTNGVTIRRITEAVDRHAPWAEQVRQAVEAWIGCAESAPAITLSWIRDVPALGAEARRLQRDSMDAFASMVQTLCDTDEWRAAGGGPVSREVAVLLLGGLRELTATTVEDGGRFGDVTEVAVRASIALLSPGGPPAGGG
jgi:AcrR family transcriptional regulator